ncbi:P-loop containing nucleoside triphosphate hydrolase protein [Dactylonectria estremocensis]|uniref:P-loop containing nucleoside triphosphate hydrolase protein n=1 Tax=Dactylonectria estremocensis TaxID=1079267 RepID=A0A9P9EQS6_9HYPO|nr:P-loop containing nucleoside triphosphate hydrolase protein [Dactylonectria estremocensis]
MNRQAAARLSKLTSPFWAFTKDRQVNNSNDARQFLQACDAVCQEQTPFKCIEVIISSTNGLKALEAAVRAQLDPAFINLVVAPFLHRLSDPGVATLNNGRFLQQVLMSILVPRSFWTATLDAHRNGSLNDAGLESFAWLSLQIVSSQEPDLEDHKQDVKTFMKTKSLLDSHAHSVRKFAYRIEKMIKIFTPLSLATVAASPGGRHDNDFEDFRQISIYPTTDELLSSQEPFLQRLDDVFDSPMETRPQVYRDWLYRLLREDMLAELREDLQIAMGKKQGRRKPTSLGQLQFTHVGSSPDQRSSTFTLNVKFGDGIFPPSMVSPAARKKFLEKSKASLQNSPIGALCCGSDIIAFGSLIRNITMLQQMPPVAGIKFKDSDGMKRALEALLGPRREELRFFAVDTAMFAYEPILQRLKDMGELPLESQITNPKQTPERYEPPPTLDYLLQTSRTALKNDLEMALPKDICSRKTVRLRGAQLESFINGLGEELAQIQGPPDTGKSFIGALIILAIIRLTKYRVLVLTYTNHALEQFSEDLIDIGISTDDMVRIGPKSTKKTEMTLLKTLNRQSAFRLTFEENSMINGLKQEAAVNSQRLLEIGQLLSENRVRVADILEYLELAEEDSFFWSAFQVPDTRDGFRVIGAKNKALRPDGLFAHWIQGKPIHQLGSFVHSLDPAAVSVWQLPLEVRSDYVNKWLRDIREERVQEYLLLSERENEIQEGISSIFAERDRRVLKSKRIISCTTTRASMYQSIISTANPDVVLVEEAGEILEAHIVAALSPTVKQVILIGDHKQLRPKVSNFKLSKEKGDGYDLNVSLFERLVLQGHRFTTLQEQHRCHPEISRYVRMLAYEDLKDTPGTHNREDIRGLTSRVTFVHHEHHEEEMSGAGERWDLSGSKGTKRNHHEAQMVLRLVRYLCQQRYKSENIVVLTPYLGQLSLLKETLREENDPYLNDLDSHDLVRAGLMAEAAAKVNKTALRLSTIDNYQGEECDIVIVSLTRSNASGDIGFLHARERLVVLMSRARNGMVLFGNEHTFMKSKKGGEMWTQYLKALDDKGCLRDGVPVRCERHPEITVELKSPEDFDKYCPDGGCTEICGAVLSCGKHSCTRHCHWVADHSKVGCTERLEATCPSGHKTKILCGKVNPKCDGCEKEAKETRRRALRDLTLEKRRLEQRDKYRKELQDLEDLIDHQQRVKKYESEENQQVETLRAKAKQLKSLQDAKARSDKAKAQQAKNASSQPTASSTKRLEVISPVSSEARVEWETMKKMDGSYNAAMDKLMGMVGLESVKRRFLTVKSSVDTKIRQGLSLDGERFSCSLLGNPGTGKTTVARIWAKFLTTVGVISGDTFEETTGSKLASKGVPGCEKLLEDIKNNGGGVLFIDEAYQLSSGNNQGGAAVLDFLLAEVENLRGKVIFILAGYSKQMESFFAHNPGFTSRFPIEMKFDDYSDDELLSILQLQIDRKYNGRMQIEDGPRGLYFRIASRRVGYSRGKEGFGNARAVENYVQCILDRQADRLRLQRLAGKQPDDLLLTRDDIIGPQPSVALTKSKAYQSLLQLFGLKEVKEILKVLLDTVKTNYERELAEMPLVEFSLNRVFLGSPGTGKTTVAKLFGQILVDLGLLSNGEVVVKTPADFVGSVLGQSEAQTNGILAATVGKVLVIDEAYGLYGGGGNSGSDPYKTAVVDTIVAEVQSVPGEDRCVLLLGYQDQMENMFQNVNPGLSRRFPLSSAFVFEDFDDEALSQILDLKLGQSGFGATDQAKRVALEVLRRARNRPNFGNAGEIDILLGRAKESHQKRSSAGKIKRRHTLEAVDFDAEFDRVEKGGTDVQKLFEGEIGRTKLIAVLEGYQKRVKDAKILDMDPEIPFNFLFRGPPGTGKTTTAKKMGKVYYDMGFLASTDVIECSATDLVGSYIGHTGPKVQALLDKALGKILFIDEAYRLGEGHFAKEAVDEIVDCVTKAKYHNKLIIILAGYDNDINSLLSTNPGMSSRFPEAVQFSPLSSEDCIQLMAGELEKKKKQLQSKNKNFDMSCLESLGSPFIQELTRKFHTLSNQDGWANARDVKQLAKDMFRSLDLSRESLTLPENVVNKTMDQMISERGGRMTKVKRQVVQDPTMRLADDFAAPPTIQKSTSTKVQQGKNKDEPSEDLGDAGPTPVHLAVRDAGVSDEVWDQLQADREKEEREETEYRNFLKAQQTARDEDRERIVRQVLAEEERRKKIEAQKAKLQKAGCCPVGYAWIKQAGGYRCAGGSHWMPDSLVEQL